MKKSFLLFTSLFAAAISLQAVDNTSEATKAPATRGKELTMAVGLAMPPYIITETDNGIVLDIMREALKDKGYTLKIKSVPLVQVPLEMKRKNVDAAERGSDELKEGIDGFYGEGAARYVDAAIALKKSGLKIENIGQLVDKSVLSFQGARAVFGKEYADMAGKNPRYEEKADQELQVLQLYAGRVQTVVCDINIFKYFREKVRKTRPEVDTSLELQYFNVFPLITHEPIFVDKQVRDDYNEGMKKLRESGRDKEIIAKYIGSETAPAK